MRRVLIVVLVNTVCLVLLQVVFFEFKTVSVVYAFLPAFLLLDALLFVHLFRATNMPSDKTPLPAKRKSRQLFLLIFFCVLTIGFGFRTWTVMHTGQTSGWDSGLLLPLAVGACLSLLAGYCSIRLGLALSANDQGNGGVPRARL